MNVVLIKSLNKILLSRMAVISGTPSTNISIFITIGQQDEDND